MIREKDELSKRCEQYDLQIIELQMATAAAEQLVRYFLIVNNMQTSLLLAIAGSESR